MTEVSKHTRGKLQQRRKYFKIRRARRRNIKNQRRQAHGLWKPY